MKSALVDPELRRVYADQLRQLAMNIESGVIMPQEMWAEAEILRAWDEETMTGSTYEIHRPTGRCLFALIYHKASLVLEAPTATTIATPLT